MKKINTKIINNVKDLHTTDENIIVDFLIKNSNALGSINYLGAFIEDIKISSDYGIKVNNKFLIVERLSYDEEIPDEVYTNSGLETPELFEFQYNLPDEFPKNKTKVEDFIMLSTVESHSCSPKMKCKKCNGSGNCLSCDARGYNSCYSCSGSGSKKVSDGKKADGKTTKYKNISCSTCHGSGKKICNDCSGSKKCSNCSGSGLVTCSRCEGTSVYQTYIAYNNCYLTIQKDFYYSEYPELVEAIKKTKNKITYDGNLIEYENINKVVLDNIKKCFEINKHSIIFNTDLENQAGINKNQKIGKVYSVIEDVPITIVDFTFENKTYNIKIVGENNIICFEELPKKHNHKVNFITKFLNFFNKKKRHLAFLHIASFMFNSDNHISEEEIILFDVVLNKLKVNQTDKNKIIDDFKIKKPLESILPSIKVVKNDKRALIFAWHCVIQDKQIQDEEIKAFDDLVNYFKINENEISLIKKKAQQFIGLSSEQMLEEYFK